MRGDDEHRVSDRGNQDSDACMTGQLALSQRFATLQPRQDQSEGEQQEEGAGPAGDAHNLFAVDGQIVAQHAVAKSETDHVNANEPSSQEEETVEGNLLLVGHGCSFWQLHRSRDRHAYQGEKQRDDEQDVKVSEVFVEGDADRGRDGGGNVVAQPVIADALVAARGGQHVDGNGGIGHGARPERSAVESAHHGEERQSARQQIETVEYETQQHKENQHLLPVERIDDISAERPEQQRGHGIARQYQANDVFCRAEMLAQVDGEQRCEDVEGEEQRKVRYHHLDILFVPKSLFFRWCHGVFFRRQKYNFFEVGVVNFHLY